MADALPESALGELDDPFAELTGPLASTIRLDFEVVDSARLTPHMQRLRLTAAQLDGFGYLPGQDVMLLVAAEGNRPVRRRYTIRQLDEPEAVRVHPRDSNTAESVLPDDVGVAVAAVRGTCPGIAVGVSTGLWITGDRAARQAAVVGWRDLPAVSRPISPRSTCPSPARMR